MAISKGNELKVASKLDIFDLGSQGVIFDSDEDFPLFGISENSVNPIEAIELNSLGADLTQKEVEFNGYVPPSIARDLSTINGLGLTTVIARDEGLTEPQITEF